MRYRIVFAAFPILIVALVLREQFTTYDETGVFISFAQGLNKSVTKSLPLAVAALTFLSITLSQTKHQSIQHQLVDGATNNYDLGIDDARCELLLGSGRRIFLVLGPALHNHVRWDNALRSTTWRFFLNTGLLFSSPSLSSLKLEMMRRRRDLQMRLQHRLSSESLQPSSSSH